MRPQSIVWFERIFFGSYLIGLINSAIGWSKTMAMLEASGTRHPAAVAIVTMLLGFGISLALTLFISRRRSKIAMWIAIVLFVIGLPAVFVTLASGAAAGWPMASVVVLLAQVFAYGLLFSPSARLWMKKMPDISPEIFR